MNPLAVFRMPPPGKITGRTSSITNSFVTSILPVVEPTAEELVEALAVLGMTPETVVCAYCGDTKSEWDHLRPLVVGKQPTGYISEICNLVPSCGKCNQSKGNKPWLQWMSSTARLSPTARGVPDLEQRVERLHAYERWHQPVRLDFASVIGDEAWKRHWENCTQLHDLMRESQSHADQLRSPWLPQ
jgi:hypothetical protein